MRREAIPELGTVEVLVALRWCHRLQTPNLHVDWPAALQRHVAQFPHALANLLLPRRRPRPQSLQSRLLLGRSLSVAIQLLPDLVLTLRRQIPKCPLALVRRHAQKLHDRTSISGSSAGTLPRLHPVRWTNRRPHGMGPLRPCEAAAPQHYRGRESRQCRDGLPKTHQEAT